VSEGHTKVRNRKANECGFEKVHILPETMLMANGYGPVNLL